ncbi:Uncharacterised protein [Citrobacter freundii]|nr:Uncharacterised protein [Citrobacter freundii]
MVCQLLNIMFDKSTVADGARHVQVQCVVAEAEYLVINNISLRGIYNWRG